MISAPWLVALTLPGCFGPIDHEGRRCPCATGFVCDAASDRCVREGTDASARLDAAGGDRDTGTPDASYLDARATGDDAQLSSLDARAEDPDASGETLDGGMDAWVATVDAWAADARTLDAWTADARTIDAWAADARTIDAWAPDAASAFAYCPAGTRFCDDFESADSDRVPPWSYFDGPPSRATDLFARGAAAARFSAAPPTAVHSVGLDITSSPSEVWARFWLLIRPRAAGTDVRDGAIFHVGDDTAPAYDNISVVLSDAGLGTYNSAAAMFRAGPTIPDDTWTCVALHVVVGDPGRVELFVGRTLALGGPERTTFAGGAIQVIDAGLTYVDPASSRMTVYLDDVAVGFGPTALGCP